MGRWITEKEFEQMKVMFIEGKNYREIGERFGRSRKTIENKFLRTGANKLFKGVEKSCKGCGETFLVTHRSNMHKRVFCTDGCKSKYNYKCRERNVGTYRNECVQCSNSFDTYEKDKKCCSPECYYDYRIAQSIETEKRRNKDRRIKVYKYDCPQCSKSGYSKYKRKFCSAMCKKKDYQTRKRERIIKENTRPVKCIECGHWFSTHIRSKVYCSSYCGRRLENRKKELYRKRRGELIRLNGEVHEDISLERLIKRDKSICYLCGDKVDVSKDTNDNYYPCIEHLTPIIKGGTHTWDNVKLAHRICNNHKGIMTAEEFLEDNEAPSLIRRRAFIFKKIRRNYLLTENRSI